ncbi:hypothetical protein BHE90_008629 [Fusarium euwallaceae]|uniref:Major facilitator superfamily (MFS) profile domain-containing protein n=1 Tax=Fusarium euwallaceae TaxID=1147111 RepID=A0A430LMD9_9HYPO|nr:hypothetical protein BHE90_008629 [Fusarium euwallaceae]
MSDIKADDIQLEHAPGTTRPSEAADYDAGDSSSFHGSYRLSIRTYMVLTAMAFAWGTCTMANIGPSTTYSYAVKALGGESISTWIPNASLFPIIGLQPIWGSLADRFGKKWFILSGGVAGVIGNVVAGSAKSTEVIIAGQALNGLGSSLYLLVIPSSMEIVPASHRSFAQGFMGSVNGLVSIMILLVSGAFAKSSSSGWRWVYYFNGIFFGVVAVFLFVFYNPPPTKLRRENTTSEALKSIDFAGVGLFLCGIIPLVVALVWGGHAYPWDSSRVVALLVLGSLFLVGFGVYEKYGRTDGLLDHRFFHERNYPLVLSVAFVDGMLLYGVNAFLPQQVAGLFTHDPIMVSVYLLPLNLCVIGGIMSSAYVLGVLKHYRILLISSLVLIAIFCGLLALVNADRAAMLLVFTGLIGLGVGVTTALPNVVLTYAVPPHLIGTAGTLLASCRGLGGTIGITIFATINGNYMSSHRIPDVTKAVVNAGLPTSSAQEFVTAFLAGNSSALATIPGATPSVFTAAEHSLEHVITESFKFVWIANAIIAVVTCVLTCFLQSVAHHMTGHVEAPLEQGKLRESAMVKETKH